MCQLLGPKVIHLQASCQSICHGRAGGTKSRLRTSFALSPPSPARAPPLLLGEGELWFGRGGALRNAREAVIRTYGSSVCFSYTQLCIYV